MIKVIISAAILALSASVVAEDVPIIGLVESKCGIVLDTEGVYGNPTPDKLSTTPADGGVKPIVRFDVLQADFYKAVIRHPMSFSENPELNDNLNWSGSTATQAFSTSPATDPELEKTTYGSNTTEYDLVNAGTYWFDVQSEVTYGFNKALPSGTYRSYVEAECIAK